MFFCHEKIEKCMKNISQIFNNAFRFFLRGNKVNGLPPGFNFFRCNREDEQTKKIKSTYENKKHMQRYKNINRKIERQENKKE